MKVNDVYNFLNEFAPFSIQEEWDNAGFLVGDMNLAFDIALIALDATKAVIDEAISFGAKLIITHHPVIFKPQKSFTADDVAYYAVKNGISIISAHTNFDAALGGVNDVLAKLISLEKTKALYVAGEEYAKLRQGQIMPMIAKDFAKTLKSNLNSPIRFCLPNKLIKNIAVCGGSGASFLAAIKDTDIDAFVTGDADHHDFLDAESFGLSLFACGHYETEQPAMANLTNLLKQKFSDAKFIMSAQKSPIHYI